MKTTRFIGDIHADFAAYQAIIEASPYPTIQVGDFGIGFGRQHPQEAMAKGDHMFIRGNHDNPAECKKTPGYIPDATLYGDWWCMGGALSIDRSVRTEGVNWWADEELSQSDLYKVMDIYETIRPDYVVTHTCPESIAPRMFSFLGNTVRFKSRTEQALESMWHIHKPKVWVFGHWHESKSVHINGTDFHCVGINETIDISIV